MSEVLIKVNNVSKKFCKDLKKSLKYGFQDLGGAIFAKKQERELRPDEFWAVKDISFEVKRGECLGLIGHNGAGKSTLLKMLNGLILPDRGEIEMRGRVGALIELGAGFNPILTGRENIFNNAAVLGFSKQETLSKLDEIIAFSEIEEFLDMPVQNYSSGMKVRLGFAVAAHMQPDILLVDEVLAVGDMGFVLKCFNQMDKLMKNTALILVSHSMPQVSRMSTKLLMMDRGQEIIYTEDVSDGLAAYYNRFKLEIGDYNGSKKVEFISWQITTNNNTFKSGDEVIVNYGSFLKLEIEIDCKEYLFNPNLHIAFYDNEQRNFAEIMNSNSKIEKSLPKYGKIKFRTIIPNINFAQGRYSITIGMSEIKDEIREILFRYQSAIYFTVHSNTIGWSPIQIDSKWEILN